MFAQRRKRSRAVRCVIKYIGILLRLSNLVAVILAWFLLALLVYNKSEKGEATREARGAQHEGDTRPARGSKLTLLSKRGER